MKNLYYATCQIFFEDVLEQELRRLEVESTERSVGGVFFRCDEPTLYKVLIHARTIAALRLVLLQSEISSVKDLYQQALSIAWFQYFSSDHIIACRASSSGKNIAPENYLMLVMKDGIVDSFRKIGRPRPSIDSDRASHLVHLQVVDNQITITLELEHELFKRGYRTSLDEENESLARVKLIKKNRKHSHPAPLKEHLAAALLYRTHWDEISESAEDVIFYDPMCGSGTIVLEAFMMAHGMSPQWLRKQWRIRQWSGFDAKLFDAEWRSMTQAVAESIASKKVMFWASDINEHATAMLRLATIKLEITDYVKIFNQDFFATKRPAHLGYIVTNPPYGERMGTREDANRLYAQMGQHLKAYYQGWNVAMLAPDNDILRCLDMRADHVNNFFNGAKRAVFLRFLVEQRDDKRFELSPDAQELKEIIEKQFIASQKIAREQYQTNAFRFYNGESSLYSAVCEYFSRAVVVHEFVNKRDTDRANKLKTTEFLRIIQEVTGLPKMDVYYKQRRPASAQSQYEKVGSVDAVELEVFEGSSRFLVQLSTYIDVGLYLDHRYLRRIIKAESQGKRFLNLFCYTASMSVVAALGGASETVSVDISKPYLMRAKENFKHNNIDMESKNHAFVRSDVKKYVNQLEQSFDLIYLDPPTFSNGKGRDSLDIQKEHVYLIEKLMNSLTQDGKLYFSTHYRRFKLDDTLMRKYHITDLTKISHDADFGERMEHNLWSIEHK